MKMTKDTGRAAGGGGGWRGIGQRRGSKREKDERNE